MNRTPPWILLTGALTLVACNVGTDEPYLAGAPLDPLQAVSTAPLRDATDVPLDAEPRVRWNDRVHPGSLADSQVGLLVGASSLDVSPKIDLLDCTLAVRPKAPLSPLTPYVATFTGLRGFGTGAQRGRVELAFTTGDASGTAPPPPVPAFGAIYSDIIGPRCASCHVSFRPPAGLNLSSPEAAEASLLEGRATGPGDMFYVVPGDHAASYLLWKLLGLPGIAGEPMPPTGSFPVDRACRTLDPDLRRVADWVDGLNRR